MGISVLAGTAATPYPYFGIGPSTDAKLASPPRRLKVKIPAGTIDLVDLGTTKP